MEITKEQSMINKEIMTGFIKFKENKRYCKLIFGIIFI